MPLKRKEKEKKKIFTKGDGGIVARKVTLLSKLLSRHKKLQHAPPDNNDEATASARPREGRDRSSVPPPGRSKPRPFQNMVGSKLANKQKKVARDRTMSQGTPEKVTGTPEKVTRKAHTDTDKPLEINIQLQMVQSPISPMTHMSLTPSTISEPVRDRSFRLAELVPENPKDQYQRVVQSSLSANLIANVDAESPALSAAEESKPIAAAAAVASTAAISLVCIACTAVLGFSWLSSISCFVTVLLALHIMNQHSVLRNARRVAISKKRKLSGKKRTLQLANSNCRSRVLAAQTSATRYDKVEGKLERSLCVDGRQNSRRRLRVATRQAANIEDMQRRLRNQVLIIISKAIIVSNKRSHRIVLNPLGLEIIISRLSMMERVNFDSEDLKEILEQHGSTQGAIKVLYRLVMDDNSKLIHYDLSLGDKQCSGKKKKSEVKRSFLGGFRK